MDKKLYNLENKEVLEILETSEKGLTEFEARKRLKENGGNDLSSNSKRTGWKIFLDQIKNSLIWILIFASVVSFFLGEKVNALVILALVIMSVFLGFFQENHAEKSLEALKKYISLKSKVLRDGRWEEIEAKKIVVGDIVQLRIGDIVPADIQLFFSDELTANESVLTGESLPVGKRIEPSNGEELNPTDIKNMVFMGTAIASGMAYGVVTGVGKNTFLGKTANLLKNGVVETDFQKSIKHFSSFLLRIVLVMTSFIFISNVFLGKSWFDSFLFAVALAVGIAPEILPAIMSVTLSSGALKMAKNKVIIKKLASVEDLGNVNVLCCDKTGTLTEGIFDLQDYRTVNKTKEEKIVIEALMCTEGFMKNNRKHVASNAIDRSLWEKVGNKYQGELSKFKLIDENEFDFVRKRTSVLVEKRESGEKYLISKGAPESIINICSQVKTDKGIEGFKNNWRKETEQLFRDYEREGFKILAVAKKEMDKGITTSNDEDEKEMIFLGFLLFSDPLKQGVKQSLESLEKLGVDIKIISGDSLIITEKIAREAGLKLGGEKIVSGEMLLEVSEEEFDKICRETNVFARVTPEQKFKIVESLKKQKYIVGFMGDGVNDAPAIKMADVGISVSKGTDIAKEAADVILLKKDLGILAQGIEIGRKTFGNIMKYILNTISANYGNMFTVAISSLFLKFIPLLPSQILLNNFISDIPLLAIAGDNVDKEFTRKPKKWDIKMISRFMIYFGFISSLFDLLLILILFFLLKVSPEVFRTAWFVESAISEIVVTFSIRTKLPFYKSKPGKLLMILSGFSIFLIIGISGIGIGKTFFDFRTMSYEVWRLIGIIVFGYFLVTELVKKYFFRKYEY